MMKLFTLTAFFTLFVLVQAFAAPMPGATAPDFSATAIDGHAFKLSDYKGKIVILEWTNHLCPFVKKHYETGNMQQTQKEALAVGAEWISIVSSAPGKQGHVTSEEAASIVSDSGAAVSAKILDESGEIGRLYDAKATPTMVVIDEAGKIAYLGAIDDQSSPDRETVKNANNYVLAALASLKEGTPVKTPFTQAYGCAVKYAQ